MLLLLTPLRLSDDGHTSLAPLYFVKTTPYFERRVLDRPYLRREWCERVLQNPLATEVQPNGLIRFWGISPEFGGRALRVVTLEDRGTIVNAFPDRNFLKRYQRENLQP